MAWTEKRKKEHSRRMKMVWAKKATTSRRRVEAPAPKDMVNAPPHYTFGRFEVIDVLEDWFPNEPLLWNAAKYVARWDKKGDPIENLEKAVWYIQRKINKLKEQQDAKV